MTFSANSVRRFGTKFWDFAKEICEKKIHIFGAFLNRKISIYVKFLTTMT